MCQHHFLVIFGSTLANVPTLSFLFHQVASRGIEQLTRPSKSNFVDHIRILTFARIIPIDASFDPESASNNPFFDKEGI
jgi:hypothetical protein